MGLVRLLQPKGQAFPLTMGGRAYCSPRGAPTMGRARLLPQRRGRTCRNFFPIMSFGKLYEAGKPKRGGVGRAGERENGKAGGRFFEKA